MTLTKCFLRSNHIGFKAEMFATASHGAGINTWTKKPSPKRDLISPRPLLQHSICEFATAGSCTHAARQNNKGSAPLYPGHAMGRPWAMHTRDTRAIHARWFPRQPPRTKHGGREGAASNKCAVSPRYPAVIRRNPRGGKYCRDASVCVHASARVHNSVCMLCACLRVNASVSAPCECLRVNASMCICCIRL